MPTVWNGKTMIMNLADVQHIEKLGTAENPNGLWVITAHTKWCQQKDHWENPAYVQKDDVESFLIAWWEYLKGKNETLQPDAKEVVSTELVDSAAVWCNQILCSALNRHGESISTEAREQLSQATKAVSALGDILRQDRIKRGKKA